MKVITFFAVVALALASDDSTKKCLQEPDGGLCSGYFEMFYYDYKSKSCKTFVYGGCGGNDNIFGSEEDCLKECGAHPPVECVHDEWMCADQRRCIKIYQHCDGKYDCEDKSDEFQCQRQYGDCDFDDEDWMKDCQWQSKNLDFEWSRAQSSRSSETGPKRNQNPRQSGYFLYINSNEVGEGRAAGVMTPVFKASRDKCHLRFWYNMNGSPSLGKLEVLSEGENGQNYSMWAMRGPQGEDWKYAHVEVGSSQDYRIVFVATRGGDNKTDIAIDEVKFTQGCVDGGCPYGQDMKNGTCTQCYCGHGVTVGCKFAGDEKICECTPHHAQRGESCTACMCGSGSTGCKFDGDMVICDCKENFVQKGNMCEAEFTVNSTTSPESDSSTNTAGKSTTAPDPAKSILILDSQVNIRVQPK